MLVILSPSCNTGFHMHWFELYSRSYFLLSASSMEMKLQSNVTHMDKFQENSSFCILKVIIKKAQFK